MLLLSTFFFFFFNDTATTEIYTLSLHDALPILCVAQFVVVLDASIVNVALPTIGRALHFSESSLPWVVKDRKSTRLNSSHLVISYAVFCLKKKKKKQPRISQTIR